MLDKKKNIYKLKYIGDKVCSSYEEITTLFIKVVNNEYYVRGDRFLNKDWINLEINKKA